MKENFKPKTKSLTKPQIIWLTLTITGLTVNILRLLSSVFLVIGCAGLTAYTVFELMTLKKKNLLNSTFLVFGVIFILVLFGGAFLNEGYPINYKGVITYIATFPLAFGHYVWKNKKNKTIATLAKKHAP